MKIIHYRQKRDWTCGPAVMRIVLGALGIRKSENALAKVLKTTKKYGTKCSSLTSYCKKHGFSHVVRKNSSIKEIKNAIKSGYLVIVTYRCPLEGIRGHFAVVDKITKNRIYLHDPGFAPGRSLTITEFLKNWSSAYERQKRWFIGIKL